MSLRASCPRCDGPADPAAPAQGCPRHGDALTLWRPEAPEYDAFLEHLTVAGGFPTYLPWPLVPGWRVSDFGVVTDRAGRAVATVGCASGRTEWDGLVDVLVVAEEPHVGLGGRCAGLAVTDPGPEVGAEPPTLRVRADQRTVPVWPVSTSVADGELDRSVLVGEASGRWLWLVLMPASAMLLVREEWPVRDVSAAGPTLVELPFEGPAPAW